MAIKSKKKSKPKQVARAPKRAPVAVPTPLFARRWVQIIAGVLVGVFAMMVFVWFTNGLRSNDEGSAADDEAASKRKAATSYQTAVEDAFGTIGVVSQGIPPTVLPEMAKALQKLEQGTVPEDASTVFADAASGAKDATKAIVTFDVAGAIGDQGFDSVEATVFTSSAQQLSLALGQFQRCAEAGGRAVDATGSAAEELLTIAQGLCDGAQAQLSQAWGDYQAALQSAGIIEPPGGAGHIPGVSGITGPTGLTGSG